MLFDLLYLQCRNSEIYNHEQVQQQMLPGISMVRDSKSDSAKPGHLYEKYGDDDKIWNALDGTFACVIYDERTQQFCAARDPIGICPMYWGKDKNGAIWFASEMKALQHQCVSFEIFPPVSMLLHVRPFTACGKCAIADGQYLVILTSCVLTTCLAMSLETGCAFVCLCVLPEGQCRPLDIEYDMTCSLRCMHFSTAVGMWA